MANKTRFKTLRNYKGIRKDLRTNKYVATKHLNGKRMSKTFSNLDTARKWQAKLEDYDGTNSNPKVTFLDAWKVYISDYVSTLSRGSRENYAMVTLNFKELYDIRMVEFDPNVITRFLHKKREQNTNVSRCNYVRELKLLNAFFNWYRETIDFKFPNPILKRHKQIGKIKEPRYKNKKMSEYELFLFLDQLKKDQFWYDFVMTQLCFAGRVQEVAGLQKSSVSFHSREVMIKDVCSWGKDKRSMELKSLPKNGEIRTVYLIDDLATILDRRMKASDSDFVFEYQGRPLLYREIQYNYNKYLKKAGLYPKFSGTHFVRHTMATLTRKSTGSLELTQAMTGHKDQKLVQHYAFMDKSCNQEALTTVWNHLKNFECVNKREQIEIF